MVCVSLADHVDGTVVKRMPSRAATFGAFDTLRGVWRFVIGMIVLVVFSASASVGVARPDRKISLKKCALGHLRVIVADAQASVYEAPEPPGPSGDLGVWGCVYGHRPYFLGPLPYASAEGSGGLERETLAGSVVAYEESATGGYYSKRSEQRVVVRELYTGRLLHRVPTGMQLKASPENVGVGRVLTLVVKNDGAVAWIAEDGELAMRSNMQPNVTYFVLESVDKFGSQLLASGPDIDPLSLALAGSTLYWTQGRAPFSSLLQ